jgi:glycosyltransferase involved in cell wall biosynthesis
MTDPRSVSCIIPAYNEAPRIRGVLQAVCRHPLVAEVIVVDDGSEDHIAEVVAAFPGVTFVVHETNQGKSKALATGIARAKGGFLLFLDADLMGITSDNVTALVEPVLAGRADISVSLRKNAPRLYRWIGLDFISGERVLPKSLVENRLPEIAALRNFQFETYLNKIIIGGRLRLAVVRWDNVASPYKYSKRGFFAGLEGDILMFLDIFKTASPLAVVHQILQLSSLRVR